MNQYSGHVENHLKPFFLGMKINQVNFDSIENFKKSSLEKYVAPYEKALKQFRDKPWYNDLRILSGGRKKSPTPEFQKKRARNSIWPWTASRTPPVQ